MAIDNCPRCGKIYARNAAKLCPHCQQQDEEHFALIRDYLSEHPKSTVTKVAQATGVRESLIIKFIRMGRIQAQNYANLGLRCERCGTVITVGRYCDDCSEDLAKAFSEGIPGKKQAQPQGRMYVSRYTRKKND